MACVLGFAGLIAVRVRGLGVGDAVPTTLAFVVVIGITLGVGADTGAGRGSSEIAADCAMT